MLTRIYTRALLAFLVVATASLAEKIDMPIESEESPAAADVFQFEGSPFENEDQELQVRYRWDYEVQSPQALVAPLAYEYRYEAGRQNGDAAPAIVPEPGSMVLLAGGLALAAMRRFRRPE